MTGWSFGGNYIAELAETEAKTGTHLLDSVVLYEGVNNFRKIESDPKDPETQPNKKKKITHDYLASSVPGRVLPLPSLLRRIRGLHDLLPHARPRNPADIRGARDPRGGAAAAAAPSTQRAANRYPGAR